MVANTNNKVTEQTVLFEMDQNVLRHLHYIHLYLRSALGKKMNILNSTMEIN